MFTIFIALFVWLGFGVTQRYSALRAVIEEDNHVHRRLSEVIRLTGKAKEAVLMYRINGAKENLATLVGASQLRAEETEAIKSRLYRSPEHTRFANAFARDQAQFQRLQTNVIEAIEQGRDAEAKRLFAEWERLESVNTARYWDFMRFVDRDLDRTEQSIRNLLSALATASLLLLALCAGMTWWIRGYYLRTLIAPLRRLNDGFVAVSRGALDTKVEIPGSRDELALMSVEFNRMTETLQESRRDLKAFVSIAAHDLRSPLATIRGFCDLLKDDVDPRRQPEAHELIERIDTIAHRSLGLMDRLLTLESSESGALEMKPVPLDEVIRESLENLDSDIRNLNAHIDVRVEGRVHGDRTHLRGLFQNLISNSLKYHRPGVEPVVRIETTKFAYKKGDDGSMLRVRVIDNGKGFDNEVANKIFAPFTRLESSSGTKGYGVGLSTCRRIVQRHKGRISAYGEVGRGAEFTVDLPTV